MTLSCWAITLNCCNRHIESPLVTLQVLVLPWVSSRQGAQVVFSLILPLRRKGWRRSGQICQVKQPVTQLLLTTGTCFLQLWDPLWGLRTARKRQDPPHSVGQNLLSQKAGQPDEESIKLEMMGEGGGEDPQSSEEVVVWVGKQGVQGEVGKRDLKTKQAGQRGPTSAVCTQIRKCHPGRGSQILSENPACQGVSPWSACTLVCTA